MTPKELLTTLLVNHSQADIARKTGIHQSVLSRIESGETKEPGSQKYRALLALATQIGAEHSTERQAA